ncbi:MAG: hypothetical protein K0R84_1139 [Clostridia bacterium]|jgi:hypothetical protein|nr:hypothetical protein [Clostridia bacterium]
MRSILLSILFLAVIIAGSLSTLYYLDNQSEALLQQLDMLETQIEAEKWDDARISTKEFKEKWVKADRTWSMLIDHYEIDYINMDLGELEAYVKNKDKANAMAKLESLQLLVEHIPEKERPSLKNIF